MPANNRYLIMNSLNITVDHFNDLLNNYKSLQISEFNPKNVIFPSNLPSPILPISYRLKCAIVTSGNTRYNGHYVAWVSNLNNTKWIWTSDTSSRVYSKLLTELENVQILFLERIISN